MSECVRIMGTNLYRFGDIIVTHVEVGSTVGYESKIYIYTSSPIALKFQPQQHAICPPGREEGKHGREHAQTRRRGRRKQARQQVPKQHRLG